MRKLVCLAALLAMITGCSGSAPSPATVTRPLGSERFPPGMAPKPERR
jgi:hypothetical protein